VIKLLLILDTTLSVLASCVEYVPSLSTANRTTINLCTRPYTIWSLFSLHAEPTPHPLLP